MGPVGALGGAGFWVNAAHVISKKTATSFMQEVS
jgi:hypothetical protein